MEPRKAAIMAALDKFVAQRPGLEFGNYGDVKAYRSEMRSITRDRHDYQRLARAVELSDSITADDIIRASEGTFSGRLKIALDVSYLRHPETPVVAHIDYTTGQYFPTEYRKAACAVLASALWAHVREHCMPPKTTEDDGREWYSGFLGREKSPTAMTAGAWRRAYFRREFGRSIANRWFS